MVEEKIIIDVNIAWNIQVTSEFLSLVFSLPLKINACVCC